jgi:P27 family predicted phage terminase small subunit
MTNRGRRPKPTALKKLEGNPGKRKLNEDEPKLPPALPEPPGELTETALAEWERVAPALFEAKILTVADRAALAAYCQSWADWLEARQNLAAPDGFTQITEKGYEQQSAWVGIANTAMNNFMKIASEFGLTPSARTRLSVNPMPDDPEEEKAKRILD